MNMSLPKCWPYYTVPRVNAMKSSLKILWTN